MCPIFECGNILNSIDGTNKWPKLFQIDIYTGIQWRHYSARLNNIILRDLCTNVMAKKIVNSKDIRDSTREKIYTRETIRKAMKRIKQKSILSHDIEREFAFVYRNRFWIRLILSISSISRAVRKLEIDFFL